MSNPCVIPVPPLGERQHTADLLGLPDVAAPLPWRVLSVAGPDARQFLQGQVTCDVREVTAEQARPGCLLNLKGRIETNFYLMAAGEALWLILPADQAEPALARLRKYALFSKVTLDLASQVVIGRLMATHDGPPLSVRTIDNGWQLTLPGQRQLQLVDPAAAGAEISGFLAAWQTRSILSGDWLLPATDSGQFQPQELDQHVLQGVSYQKGCYLGQEIVARLYFRGQLKQRLSAVRLTLPASPPEDELTLTPAPGSGQIVAAAWRAADSLDLLMLLPLEAGPVSLNVSGQTLDGQQTGFQR